MWRESKSHDPLTPLIQEGWTALIFAVNQGHLEIVKLLLEGGAAVDTETKVHGVVGLILVASRVDPTVVD